MKGCNRRSGVHCGAGHSGLLDCEVGGRELQFVLVAPRQKGAVLNVEE